MIDYYLMKRKMSALQKKYFGKRHKKISTRKVGITAKGRYRRAAGRARGYGGSVGGKFGGIIPPVLGGIADSFLNGMKIPGTSIGVPNGVGAAAVGWFMKDNITRNIGLYQLGQSLPGMMSGLTGGAGTTKGGFL
jgi:hypothetical protein